MKRHLPGFATRLLVPAFLAASSLAVKTASAQDLQPPPPLEPAAPVPPYTAPGTPYSPGSPYAPGAATSGPVYGNSSDESKDSGLGLEWVYLNADIGVDYTNMNSLNSSNLQLQKTQSFGPAFGLGAGVRLLFFTAGARVRDLQLSDFSLWEVNAEAAFHIRIDHVDPYFGVRGGYAFVGTLSSDAVANGASNLTVHGFNAGLMFGFDYYFNHLLSVGLDGNPDFLFLQRPPVTLAQLPLPPGVTLTPQQIAAFQQQSAAYQQSGSSIGFGFAGTAHFGVHF
jgi:hypothetical protein